MKKIGNAKKRNSTCLSDFRERVFGANPYEEKHGRRLGAAE